MATAMATALREAQTQSEQATPTSKISSEKIAELIESRGFRKSIAQNDFQTAVNAVTESFNGSRGLFLTGSCGCGKTHLMRVLYSLPSKGPKYWVDCSDVNCNWLLDPKQNSRFSEMLNTNVFLDDLGTEVKVEYGRRSDWIGEFIRMYHARGTQRLFISTNLNGKQMLELYDERIVDRIMELCVVAKFNGNSKRERKVV